MPITDDELAHLVDLLVRAVRHNRFDARTRLRAALELHDPPPAPAARDDTSPGRALHVDC